jgi:GT2 family glycosyltransferase
VVVDNGSTDGSAAMVRERFAGVQVLETGANLGFAEGCNRGIELTRGAWVATINNDAVPRPDWIAELRHAVERADDRLGMIQSKILFKGRAERTNSTGLLLFANGTARDRDFDEFDRGQRTSEEVFCPTAGAALYRRAMLEQTRTSQGIFDRSFFMYFEDVDLGWRCRLAGWKAEYLSTAIALHAFQGSSRKRGSDFVDWYCKRNRMRALAKNASPAFILRSLPRTLSDLFWVLRRKGFRGFSECIQCVWSAFGARREITCLMRVGRREVEERWVAARVAR